MHKIVYMEWVKTRVPARYEIGGSGVTPVRIDEFPEAREAVDVSGFNLYGYKPLLKALSEYYEVTPEQVVTTQGTSMANYLAIAASVHEGDEVLVEKPAYEPLLDIPLMLGCKVNRFQRRFKSGFQLDLDHIASRITKRTKLIVMTNLHNPSGVLASEEELRAVAKLARKVGAVLMVDEVYMDFLFENRPRSAVHFGPNVLVTCSLTKVYGLDGLRCGWVLAPPKLAKAMWRLQDFFGVNGAMPAETISVAAFQHLQRFQERTRKIIDGNRPIVEQFMSAHQDKLKWIVPDAGPVCFPKLLSGDVDGLCEILREQYDVGVIPGHFFEMPKHFRLGFGGSTENLKTGLALLSQALSQPLPT